MNILENPRTCDNVHVLLEEILHTSESKFSEKTIGKLLDDLSRLLRQRVNRDLLYQVVQTYFKVSYNSRINKKWEKIFKEFDSQSSSESKSVPLGDLVDIASIFLQKPLGKADLLKLSSLIEHCAGVRNVFDVQFVQLLVAVRGTLGPSADSSIKEGTNDLDQDLIHSGVKVTLQIFQFMPNAVLKYVTTADTSVLQSILSTLVSLLLNKNLNADCTLLAGIALAKFFTTFVADNTVETIKNVLENMTAVNQLDLGTCGTFKEMSGSQTNRDTESQNVYNFSFGHIAFLSGILQSAKLQLLAEPTCDKLVGHKRYIFIEYLFVQLCGMSEGQNLYHLFQVLNVWYSVAFRLLAKHGSELHVRLFAEESQVVQKTLDLIWKHWDSPVDGVSERASAVFSTMIQLHVSECRYHDEDDSVFLSKMLSQLMEMSWQMKGKYRLLSSLIQYYGAGKTLKEHPALPHHLLSALHSNYYASACGETYRQLIQQAKKEMPEAAMVTWWSKGLQKTLMNGLESSNSTLRLNTMHYWLKDTLLILPSSLTLLLGDFEQKIRHVPDDGKSELLFAWIAILKTAKALDLKPCYDQSLLVACLHHLDDDIRAEAMSFLCTSQKKADSPSVSDVCLLQRFLLCNMNVDSPSFRQSFITQFRHLMVRVRDSAIGMVKTGQLSPELTALIDFVDWVVVLCVSSLFPASCYQRRVTALQLIRVVFETLVSGATSNRRKGLIPEGTVKLLQAANRQQKWQWFTRESHCAILQCIEDGSNEIRELAASLVHRYFTHRDRLQDTEKLDMGGQILDHALVLCNSPKASDSESGALYIKIVFQNFVLSQRKVYHVKDLSGVADITEARGATEAAMFFLNLLMEKIKHCMDVERRDVLQAAKDFPAHGLVHALGRCITETENLYEGDTAMIHVLAEKVIVLCADLVQRMLQVLSGDTQNEDVAPSFAEMGTAIEKAAGTEDGGEEDPALSAEHQIILAWCWLNIKECCVLCGKLMEVFHVDIDGTSGVLTVKDVHIIGDLFLKVLTRCRHKGAIESCLLGFSKYCQKLMSCDDITLNQIPNQHLQEALKPVCSNRTLASSVSRQSAGLPGLVQCILAAESKLRKDTMLHSTMIKLLEIAGQEVPGDYDQCLDLAQVHAMNIMKALFRDAGLAATMLSYACRALMLAVEALASPAWAVRNAATLLFSDLVLRMMGQKVSQNNTSFASSTSVVEFFALYPQLRQFFLDQIQAAVTGQQQHRLHLHPGLFPVLAILAKLGPSVGKEERRFMSQLRAPLGMLLGNPILAVRKLVAMAMIPLVDRKEVMEQVEVLIQDIPAHIGQCKFNQLHGCLTLMEKLLLSCGSEIRPEDKARLNTQLLQKSWILDQSNQCDLVKAKYVEILMLLQTPVDIDVVRELDTGGPVKIGHGQYEKVSTRFSLCTAARKTFTELLTCIQHCVCSQQQEIRRSSLEWLQEELKTGCLDLPLLSEIQSLLFSQLFVERYQPNLSILLDLLHSLYSTYHIPLPVLDTGGTVERLVQLQKYGTTVRAKLLPVVAIIVVQGLETENLSILKDFTDMLLDYSQPTQNEDFRMEVAKALHIAAPRVFGSGVYNAAEDEYFTCVSKLFKTILNLLEDEQTDIRWTVSKMVGQISHIFTLCGQKFQTSCLNCNQARGLLCQYMCKTFLNSSAALQFLCSLVYSPGQLTEALASLDTAKTGLFEQEEANIYAEEVITCKLLQKCLKASVQSMRNIDRQWVSSQVIAVSGELQNALALLMENSAESDIFSLVSQRKIFTALSTSLIYVDLLLELCQQHEVPVLQHIQDQYISISKRSHFSFLLEGHGCFSV
ncbi:thyroid adenoma-associated protein homolog [Lingula anatina]|uniref:Thyroid adenoma-associated protein homolog n=1 Tax=Lingula anatina TaxID=7574 RepID=A0A1S3I8V2_LINAN|nr:thyroid adenoma-associated protein homolog [Lingula anatina]|eukprot:XP_013394296.1 thyroid adenoma-associated protein homolog [Lingula anatina]